MARLIALVLAIAAPALPLAAQRPDTLPIDTDRPDFTDGTHPLGRGLVQLELGYTYQRARGRDAADSHSFPEAVVRIGVSNRAEIRVGDNFLVQRDAGSGAASGSGFDDLYLGTKVAGTAQHGAIPAVSFEVQAHLPTGSEPVSGNEANRVLPGAALLLGWETSGPWSAGLEVFGARTPDTHSQAVGSFSLQYQASGRAQFYAEYFTIQPVDAGARGEHYVNSGVLFLLSRTTQLDARAGAGLNRDADRYFLGFGFAVRR